MRKISFAVLLLIGFWAMPAHARDTQNTKYNREYFQCVDHALEERILTMVKNKEAHGDDTLKALGQDSDPVYAACQALPGKNTFAFNTVYCGNVATLGAMAHAQKNPKGAKFIQSLAKRENANNHPWDDAQKCLMAAPAKMLSTPQTFMDHCKKQIQKSAQNLKSEGADQGLSEQDVADVVNVYMNRVYATRMCLKSKGTLD